MSVTIEYAARWKEELVGTINGNHFVVELTMGRLHVYFPTESVWEAGAPEWAKGKYLIARDAAEEWAEKNKSGFAVEDNTWIS